MASIKPNYSRENGKLISFRIRAFKGESGNGGKTYTSKTMKVSPSWSEKTAWRKAVAEAAVFEKEMKANTVSNSNITFQDYAEYVLNLKAARGVKPTTLSRYRSFTKLIYPRIGCIKLKDLKPGTLNEFYTELQTTPNQKYAPRAVPRKSFADILIARNMTRKALSELSGVSLHAVYDLVNGKETSVKSAEAIAAALNLDVKKYFAFTSNDKTLSEKTVYEYHRFIHTVLEQAVAEELVPRNVASLATPPKIPKKDVNYFSLEQIAKIREVMKDAPIKWRCIVEMLFATGVRRGELLGLKWEDVDLEEKQVTIHKNLLYLPERGIYLDTPKTETSNRKISLPEGAVETLKDYHTWQAEEILRLGEFYQDQGFVFAQDNGSPMHPDSINTWMERWMDKRCGFHVNPHAFRHSMASMLYFSGVDPVTISKRLGHANVSTTANIYAHLMDKPDKRSADIIDRIVYSQDHDDYENH